MVSEEGVVYVFGILHFGMPGIQTLDKVCFLLRIYDDWMRAFLFTDVQSSPPRERNGMKLIVAHTRKEFISRFRQFGWCCKVMNTEY
jgi:hypothetical protein